jgi:hypothetical protein
VPLADPKDFEVAGTLDSGKAGDDGSAKARGDAPKSHDDPTAR